MIAEAALPDKLADRIAREGPISVAEYMAAANAHYYATRDPFGADGDFITAPEISQMFGELIGLWLADLWNRAGRPAAAHYVELGPGRGTLAADALRAMRSGGLEPPLALVETSPVLRRAQAERLGGARWHDSIETLPDAGPLLIVANEFFDALPIRQFERRPSGWRERMVARAAGGFGPVVGEAVDREVDEAIGAIVETSPDSVAIMTALARRLVAQGGAMLVVDYGHVGPATGDTLQAVSHHSYADPWAEPGERDLTAHVDFAALRDAAVDTGARVHGPRGQGEWLRAMGIDLRTAILAKAGPERAAETIAARDRLVGSDAMGRLFKAMAIMAPTWPEPEGF